MESKYTVLNLHTYRKKSKRRKYKNIKLLRYFKIYRSVNNIISKAENQ